MLRTSTTLLQDVKQAILEEPRRLNMNHVAVNLHDCPGLQTWVPMTKKYEQLPKPSCGTVGCFAGWVQMLTGLTAEQSLWNWTEGAVRILGNDLEYRFGGDTGTRYNVFNWGEGDGIIAMRPGTRAYARQCRHSPDQSIHQAERRGKAVLQARPIQRS